MNHNPDQMLAQVAEEAFASMTFIFPAEGDERSPVGAMGSVSASLDFSGPFNGNLTITIPEDMLPILASNMLGLESPALSKREQQEDTLREVLNVISGNLLPKIASPSDVFHVHPPQLVSDETLAEIISQGDLKACVHLLLDCGEAQLNLLYYSPAPETV